MESLLYPWRVKVDYQTNEEYQEQLASVMKINPQAEHVPLMDNLYSYTKDDNIIMELCTLAADKLLLSPEAEYGQVMMFSYDCFARFHLILQWYFVNRFGENIFGEEEEEETREMEKKVIENREWLRQYFSGENRTSISK